MKISNRMLINTSLFLSMMVFAIAYTVASPMLIEISKKLGISVGAMGYSFSAYFTGSIAGSFISSFYTGKNNRKLLLIFSFILYIMV